MKKITTALLILIIVSCRHENKAEEGYKHKLEIDGENLKITYKGEADEVHFKMLGGIEQVLEEKKADVFEGQLKIPDLDNGIFQYSILIQQKDSTNKMINKEYGPDDGERFFKYIGKNRLNKFSAKQTLNGVFNEVQIESDNLEETRILSIYKPTNITKVTPIIYMTDGQVLKKYVGFVEDLIDNRKIIPLIIVGIHSSKLNRYEEYVNNGNEHFAKHEEFVFKEVMSSVEKEIEDWQEKRYMYGFSNGGAFSMYCGINYPSYFEGIISFSTADYITERIQPIEFKYNKYPRFYMGAGKCEKYFYEDNIRFVKKMKEQGIDVEMKEFISGHDNYVWQIEFLEYLLEEFNED